MTPIFCYEERTEANVQDGPVFSCLRWAEHVEKRGRGRETGGGRKSKAKKYVKLGHGHSLYNFIV